jgi:glycosyltransferase involved in cell wall biosynthesis
VKVAFLSQVPWALDAGGLEVQIKATAAALRQAGMEVEFFDPWKRTFDADLLHCFGSDYQLAETVTRASARGIPVVVSSVFAPHRPDVFYLAWRFADRGVPMTTSFGARAKILRAADAVVALTALEAEHVQRFFGADRARIHVIPNGVEQRFFGATGDAFAQAYQVRNFALLVASVARAKNQLRLVEASEGTAIPLVLVGAPASRDRPYADHLARTLERRPDVLWIRGLPHESPLLVSAFASARVHVLPSLVEVQPLAALEAAAAGANLVVSGLPAMRGAFGESAWYCDPRSAESIRKALVDAHRAPRGQRYTARPDWLVSWDDVARRLAAVYGLVLAQAHRVQA